MGGRPLDIGHDGGRIVHDGFAFPPPAGLAAVPSVFVGLSALLLLSTFALKVRRTAWAVAAWLLLPPSASAALATMDSLGQISGNAASVGTLAVWCLAAAAAALRASDRRVGSRWACGVLSCGLVACGGCMGLFEPKLAGAREAATRTECKNRLKSIAYWFHTEAEKSGRFPDAVADGVGWRKRFDEGFDSDAGRLLACPTTARMRPDAVDGFASFGLPVGAETAFPGGRGVRLEDIADGTGQTLLVLEAVGRRLPLFGDEDVPVDELPPGVNLPGEQPGLSGGWVSSDHVGGGQVSMADGTVRWMNESIDPDVLRALSTAAGGETVGDR